MKIKIVCKSGNVYEKEGKILLANMPIKTIIYSYSDKITDNDGSKKYIDRKPVLTIYTDTIESIEHKKENDYE